MKLLTLLLFVALMIEAAASAKPPCCKDVPANGPCTDTSLYQVTSKWQSDVGREIPLSVLRGRPQVVAMFFAHCEYACPLIVGHLKALEAALPPELREKVDFLLVTFDNDRDSIDALAAYRKREKLGDHWTLLRGKADDVRELSALIGVNYAKDSRGQFAHSNVITILNAEGEIAFQHLGLADGTPALIEAIKRCNSPAAAATK